MEQVKLAVKGMTCHHCILAIEGKVGKLPGVKQVKVNLMEAAVGLEFNANETNLEQIKETIEDLGYIVCH